jgi:phosphatidylethanolamine-binding protein (PEBP) family uncharacterized protein
MPEHVPAWLSGLLRDRRARHEKLVATDPGIRVGVDTIAPTNPAFAHGGRLPAHFTAYGIGISPPLVWDDMPDSIVRLDLIVEDPDAPASKPPVHAIVWDIPSDERRIAEGAIVPDSAAARRAMSAETVSCAKAGYRRTNRPVMANTTTPFRCTFERGQSRREPQARRVRRFHRRQGPGHRPAHRYLFAGRVSGIGSSASGAAQLAR